MPRDTKLRTAAGGWKQAVAGGLYRTGLLRALHSLSRRYEMATGANGSSPVRRVRTAKYVVLGYHRVGVDGVPLYCTLPQAAFAEQMEYVARHYRVLSIQQMAAELEDPTAQGLAVVVTFDDGYMGTFTEAFPVLQRYKIPVTVYLAAGAIETGETLWYDRIFLRFQKAEPELRVVLDSPKTFHLNSYAARIEGATDVVTYLRTVPDETRQAWCKAFEKMIPLSTEEQRGAMMDWKQIRLMQKAGVSFGAHTMTHPIVSRLSTEALTREVDESKALIERRLDSKVQDFAFPFGKADECGTGSSEIFRCLGFSTALTTIVGVNRPGTDLFRLRRLVVGNDSSMARFAFQLHRLFFHPGDEEHAGDRDLAIA